MARGKCAPGSGLHQASLRLLLTIFVSTVALKCHVGVLPCEKLKRQRTTDLTFDLDLAKFLPQLFNEFKEDL